MVPASCLVDTNMLLRVTGALIRHEPIEGKRAGLSGMAEDCFEYSVLGVQVHDARLAAAMYVLSRFDGLTAIHPSSIHA